MWSALGKLEGRRGRQRQAVIGPEAGDTCTPTAPNGSNGHAIRNTNSAGGRGCSGSLKVALTGSLPRGGRLRSKADHVCCDNFWGLWRWCCLWCCVVLCLFLDLFPPGHLWATLSETAALDSSDDVVNSTRVPHSAQYEAGILYPLRYEVGVGVVLPRPHPDRPHGLGLREGFLSLSVCLLLFKFFRLVICLSQTVRGLDHHSSLIQVFPIVSKIVHTAASSLMDGTCTRSSHLRQNPPTMHMSFTHTERKRGSTVSWAQVIPQAIEDPRTVTRGEQPNPCLFSWRTAPRTMS